MNDLLIHADPGARAHFLAAWLQNALSDAGFDVGATTSTKFFKIHNLENVTQLTSFSGPRIRIKPTFDQLALQLVLFLRKNVHTQLPNFTKNEFSLETFSKVYIFAKAQLKDDSNLNYSLYSHTINFEDTFNLEKLIDLYYKINGVWPDQKNIDSAILNNNMNQVDLDPNHACRIAAMVLETEYSANLLEKNRYWSLPVIYQTTPINKLYQTIQAKIVPKNYEQN
jgi:hypothetical protein